MARRPRLDLDRFHHSVNPEVDKHKFLEIICKSCNA